MSPKSNNHYFVIRKAVAALLLSSLFLSVAATADTYYVRNDEELKSVLARHKPEEGPKTVIFTDNIIVENPQYFRIDKDDDVHIKLDRFNFQGNGAVIFEGEGDVHIYGSTTGFNGGLHIRESVQLTYHGIYSMSGTDRFGESPGDDVTVNLTTPGSVWNGSLLPGPYIHTLSAADDRHGTLIIGDKGKATMNVTNGNTVKNAETILGAYAGSEGGLNLSGGEVNWFTAGTFYVGYEGKGTLNISGAVNTRTGSIVVGKEVGSDGELNISGPGTVVNLYGRLEEEGAHLKARGTGVMNLTNGAVLNFDERSTRLGDPSGYVPKLGLGNGASLVKDSKIIGALDGGTGWIIGTEDGTLGGTLNNNSLTFNNSTLEGSLRILMGVNIFESGAILTPGVEEYRDARFGRIDFVNDLFIHRNDAKTYIDFDVYGDSNFVPTVVYPQAASGYRGYDLITIQGDAMLAGDVYFRPQSGYYTDHIDVGFMRISGDLTDQYERLHLTPNRWFRNPTLEFRADTGVNRFYAERNMTPFTDVANSYNLHGVGGGLNDIYNAQNNAEWLNILDWMWMMNDDELRGAMRQLSGETRASSFFMPTRSPWRYVFDRTSLNEINRYQHERQRSNGTFQSQAPKIVKNDLWATPVYDYFRASFDGNATSATNSRVGVMVGYDRVVSPAKSTLGFLFSYTSPEMTQWYSRVSADDYLMGLHFNTLLRDRYELKLWGSYGTQAYRLHREIELPDQVERQTAGYTGNTVALSSQIAMPIKWRGYTLRPLAALDLNVVQQNAATERGHEEIALHYSNACWTQLSGRVGVKADYIWRRWDGSASLAYALMFAGEEAPTVRNQFVIGGSSFKVRGTNLGRHFVNLGLGGSRWLNDWKTHRVFVQYNGEYGQYSNEQTVSFGYQRLF